MSENFDENFDDIMNDFDGDDTAVEEKTMKDSTDSAEDDDVVLSGKDTITFDFSKASKKTKRPERVNLDGKTITIVDADIQIPGLDTEWQINNNTKKEYKDCMFKVSYDKDGQYEYYSGVKVFPVIDEKTGKKMYSEPSIHNKGKTQASMLKKAYAEFKGKSMEEISLHEFLNYLLSKPKGVIEWKGYEWNDETTMKNMITKFV